MIQKTAIVGMGALGVLYADCIVQAKGKDAVSFVMDSERLQKYQGKPLYVNGRERLFRLQDSETAESADLVIVAVKYGGLSSALDTMQNCVGEHTIILSVMNGISSEQIIAKRFGMEHLIDTVAQGMDAMKFGNELHYSKMGELRIGIEAGQKKENLDAAAVYLDAVQIPYVIEEDILHRLWGKFMLNVGVNQTCLAYETTYSGALDKGSEANRMMLAAMREVIALANAEGIGLTEADLEEYVRILGTLAPDGMPSMRQDGVAKRYSEVEMFAGTVLQMAEKHRLKAPANAFLYRRIKEMESAYAG